MSKIPEFHFDFSKVSGLELAAGAEVLFKQMEDHYNKHIKPAPVLFGEATFPAPVFRAPVDAVSKTEVGPAPKRPMVDPDKIVAQAAIPHTGPIDTETVDEKTIQMRSFSIKDAADLGIKSGGAMLKGVTDKGVEVFDKLLPGYDEQPYGPVVQGESGRYNLKASK